MANTDGWKFLHDQGENAEWAPGLRTIMDYRDLGTKGATNGQFVAHLIRRNDSEEQDAVAEWHVHDCDFQFVYVLKGWAKFEFEGEGVRTMRAGDCINQRPGIPHREIELSDDYEVLEIVSPADFGTRLVDGPA